jgi:regulator of RNase E activity RraB
MSTPWIVVAAVVLLLAVAALAWKRPRAAAEAELPDRQVIAQLRQAGSDLSRPHPIEFFLYFPDEAAASAAAAELAGQGFGQRIERAARGPAWLLFLTRSMPPEEARLVALRRELEAVAARHGGEYDGWGTPVVPGA